MTDHNTALMALADEIEAWAKIANWPSPDPWATKLRALAAPSQVVRRDELDRCTDSQNCKRCSEDTTTPHSGIPWAITEQEAPLTFDPMALIDECRKEFRDPDPMSSQVVSEPDRALLVSMATCLNHGFGLLPADRQESMLCDMRKLWDEVQGCGYYTPERRSLYMSMLTTPALTPEPVNSRSRERRVDGGRILTSNSTKAIEDDSSGDLWPQKGALVRYGNGTTALAILGERHANGWHGDQCMGGYVFFDKTYRPSKADMHKWLASKEFRQERPTTEADERIAIALKLAI